MAITKESLLAAGFKPYPVNGDPYLVGGVAYQLRESTDTATCYFLDARFFDFNGGEHLQFEARLYLDPEKRAGVATDGGFTVQLHDAGTLDLEKVRAFFADAYYRLDCQPDPQ